MNTSSDHLTLLISKLREDPNLDTCTLTLQDEDFLRLFEWLIKGDDKRLPDQVFDDDARLSADKQRFRAEDTTPDSDDRLRERFPRSLKSLELIQVAMNDLGFNALIKWLQCLHEKAEVEGGSERLSKLYLPFNCIQGTAQLAEAFISALSFPSRSGHPSSSLSSLILSGNPLSAEFKQIFFTLLPFLPSLQLLHLNLTGLTRVDAGFLASYIGRAGGDCKLVELHANANNMEYWGVKKVVNAIRRCWTIERVELFANSIDRVNDEQRDASDDPEEDGENTDEETRYTFPSCFSSPEAIIRMTIGSGCEWPRLQKNLKNTLTRNIFLKQRVIEQALKLLRYSRLLLWKNSASHPGIFTPEPLCSKNLECPPRPEPVTQDEPPSRSPYTFPFIDLPTEIQLSVLSHLGPFLSTAQKLRIFEYASDKATLPTLRLCLPSSQPLPSSRRSSCIPDPADLGFGLASSGISNHGKKTGSLLGSSSNPRSTHSTGCSGGSGVETKGMKVQREIERRRWLTKVGCDSYDPGAPSA